MEDAVVKDHAAVAVAGGFKQAKVVFPSSQKDFIPVISGFLIIVISFSTEQPANVAVNFKLVGVVVGFEAVTLYLFTVPLGVIVAKELVLSLEVKGAVLVHSTVVP